jgi:transposase InsO family protein
MPWSRLVDIDTHMREAAARPVIVPDQIVIDHGRVFVSETFERACDRLGISVQPARKDAPTDKGVVEATNDAIKTPFAQHAAGYTGGNPTLRGRDGGRPSLDDVITSEEPPTTEEGWRRFLNCQPEPPLPHLRPPLEPRRPPSRRRPTRLE